MDDGGGASAADEEGMANALDAETGAERGCEDVDAMVGMVCTGAVSYTHLTLPTILLV